MGARLGGGDARAKIIAAAVVLGGCGRIGFGVHGTGDAGGGSDGDGDGGASCVAWQLRVTNDAAVSARPTLASDGTTVAVAWEDSRDGNIDAYFARIDLAGTKLGGDVRVSMDAADSPRATVVAARNVYAVAWSTPALPEARVALIDASDVITSGGTISMADEIALTFTGTEIATATRHGGDVFFSRWPVGGTPSPVQITTSGLAFAPALTSHSAGSAIAWVDSRDGIDNVYFVRLDPTGAKVGVETQISTADFGAFDPSIAWTGLGYAITWSDYRTDALAVLRLTTLDAVGVPRIAEQPLTDSTFAVGTSSVIAVGDAVAVAWDDAQIYRTQIDALGVASPHAPVATGTAPSMLALGEGVAVAWAGDDDEIYVARFCP